jgi:cytochrome c553
MHEPMSTTTSARAILRAEITMRRIERALFSLAAMASLSACNSAPSDLREWKPADHRHQAETPADNGRRPQQVTGNEKAPMPGLDEVTIAAWRATCSMCHGQLGRGDGPQGPMTQARDLSDPAWQASVTDAQVRESITKGKGRMPPSGLPATTVEGLTHLVRLFNRDRMAARPAPAPSTSASPAKTAGTASATPK